MSLPQLLAWCRPGFEPECAQALAALDATLDGGGWARTTRGSGRVEFTSPAVPALLPRWGELVFARQALEVIETYPELPADDRLGAPLARLADDPRRWCDVWVEAADSDEGRELAGLCRALNAAAVAALRKAGLIDRRSRWRLHLALTGGAALYLAAADTRHAAPWPGGIPRLRFPRGAPSRSTVKLEEAFLVLLSEGERDAWLQPGMSAVDLGAAPGGWTYQFVQRSIHVTAVDNGPMDAALLDSGLVRHRREDGFRFRPDRPVDWLVCDMVEQPRRVAALMGQWLADGACARAMFNLKLPMKKRWDEVQTCFALLHKAVPSGLDLRARQLYHDREEITVFAAVRAR